MPDIHHEFSIESTPAQVFAAVSTPQGLDHWWTQTCSGERLEGGEYRLGFGSEHAWAGVVRGLEMERFFELEITEASPDWVGTRVGFRLDGGSGVTGVRFSHTGWPELSDHFRTSSFCWAMYLRLLKRNLEQGEFVPYCDRPSA